MQNLRFVCLCVLFIDILRALPPRSIYRNEATSSVSVNYPEKSLSQPQDSLVCA